MCVNHLLLSFSAYLSYQYSCIQKRSLDIFKLVKVVTLVTMRKCNNSYLLPRCVHPWCLCCQRCAVDAIDQEGATALHVAAEHGGVEVCWTLLQRTGYRMLHWKNHHGLTPLDLSKQGKTFR